MINNFNNPYPQTMPQVQPSYILVENEQEARSYPVAPGSTMSFKHRTEPYIYIKAMGFSQFDTPLFEVYKREVGEEQTNIPQIEPIDLKPITDSIKSLKGEFETIREDIDSLKDEIELLKNKRIRRKENDTE